MEDLWDDRNWQLALTTDKPQAAYHEMMEAKKSLATSTPVDELPKHEQDWLRAV